MHMSGHVLTILVSLALAGCASSDNLGDAPGTDLSTCPCESEPTCTVENHDNGTATLKCDDGTSSSFPTSTPEGMVFIPGGEFLMGCDQDPDDPVLPPCEEDEKPAHWVELNPYFIDRYEVTVAEYKRCAELGPCPPIWWVPEGMEVQSDSLSLPMGVIDWRMAEAYCSWIGRRLPAEAEWEFAARGTDGRVYPWGNEPSDCENNYALVPDGGTTFPWICDEYILMHEDEDWTVVVWDFPADRSPFGVMAMAGGLPEVVHDWYSADYFSQSPREQPRGPAEGDLRVIKGSGYIDVGSSDGVRSSSRSPVRIAPEDVQLSSSESGYYRASVMYGFRCAL